SVLNGLNPEDIVNEYLTETKLEGNISLCKEISISEFWELAIKYENRQNHEEEDNLDFNSEIFSKFIPQVPRYNYNEHMITSDAINYEEPALYTTAMDNEIARIKGNNNPVFVGHPVHYFIKGREELTVKQLHNKLTAVLFANRRIENARIVTLKVDRYDRLKLSDGIALVEGGSMLIDLTDSNFEDLGNFKLQKFITELVHCIHEYKQRILFTICYEDEHDRVISAFLEKIEGISFVYIQPELMTYQQAVKMLTNKAQRFQSDPLPYINLLDQEQGYFSETEIMNLFRDLKAKQLKESLFPEYANIAAQQLKKTSEVIGKAQKDFDSLIGLSKAKELVRCIVTQKKAAAALLEMGINQSVASRHMSFTGNPGTAKTTVARHISKILRDEGILTEGDLIEVGRADLVGEYVGHTAIKVREVFKRARGSVLFIDEAYALWDDRKGLYGDEAIATIVQEMENARDEVIVIFAGYPEQMRLFIDRNPGLKSRINFELHFDDYTKSELLEITMQIANKLGYQVSPSALDHVSKYLDIACQTENSGNGRLIRNIVEEAILNHTARLFQTDKPIPTKEEVIMLEAEDFRPIQIKDDDRISHRSKTKSLN
ncbi:MAG: AAA family ATPase, partial [Erysipelotrichaceae bacterium]